MNAVSNPDINLTEESDTESIPEESAEYYEPLSNAADDEEPNFQRLVNGHVENGISCLDMSDDEEEEEEEEKEEERMREAMQRAFRDDERRRRAPLTQENTTIVMEAMRGISFRGLPPDWAAAAGDRWMDQLATIRQSPFSSSSSSS